MKQIIIDPETGQPLKLGPDVAITLAMAACADNASEATLCIGGIAYSADDLHDQIDEALAPYADLLFGLFFASGPLDDEAMEATTLEFIARAKAREKARARAMH